MTDQTSETTPDGLDVAAVKRVERYLDGRSGDDLIDWNGGGAGPELLASDLTLLLAALDEARGERDIARHAAEAWQVAHDEAETRAEAAEAEVAYLRRAHHEMTNAAADARDRVEGTTEPARNSDIEALIEASSFGTPEAKAARESVAPEIGSAIALAAKYLGRAKAAESALERVRALADECASSGCIHLNDLWGRLRAALATADADATEGEAVPLTCTCPPKFALSGGRHHTFCPLSTAKES